MGDFLEEVGNEGLDFGDEMNEISLWGFLFVELNFDKH